MNAIRRSRSGSNSMEDQDNTTVDPNVDITAQGPIMPNPNIKSEEEPLDTFLQKLKTSEDYRKMIIPRSFKLTQDQTDQVVGKFAENQELSWNQAMVVIALLFQSGGTNRSCDGNLQVKIFNKDIKLANLRKALNECKLKGNERKLARSLATQIAEISIKLSIPGNLAKKISREYPERKFAMEELVWLSEFQVDNPSCPEESRKLISDCFKNRKDNTGAKKPKGKR